MPTCRKRSRRQNAWRIESLEDRNLLNDAWLQQFAEVHMPAQHSKPIPKHVTITAHFKGTSQISNKPTQLSPLTGSGKASGIGTFTVTVTPSLPDFSEGTFTIRIASGGSLSGMYSGSATPTNNPSVDRVKLSGPIFDGTTPFAGASGTFSVSATVNFAASQSSGTIKATFNHN